MPERHEHPQQDMLPLDIEQEAVQPLDISQIKPLAPGYETRESAAWNDLGGRPHETEEAVTGMTGDTLERTPEDVTALAAMKQLARRHTVAGLTREYPTHQVPAILRTRDERKS